MFWKISILLRYVNILVQLHLAIWKVSSIPILFNLWKYKYFWRCTVIDITVELRTRIFHNKMANSQKHIECTILNRANIEWIENQSYTAVINICCNYYCVTVIKSSQDYLLKLKKKLLIRWNMTLSAWFLWNGWIEFNEISSEGRNFTRCTKWPTIRFILLEILKLFLFYIFNIKFYDFYIFFTLWTLIAWFYRNGWMEASEHLSEVRNLTHVQNGVVCSSYKKFTNMTTFFSYKILWFLTHFIWEVIIIFSPV